MDAALAMVLLTVMVKWSMGETNNALTVGDTYAMFGVKKGVHGWRGPRGKRYVVVDQTGAGHYPTVQDAVDSVPRGNRMRVIVFIRPGIYREKVTVPWSKPYITFQGAGRDKTFIEWHNKASDIGADGQQLHTYNTASVTILANHFSAKNITFVNSSPAPLPGVEGYQAVALRVSADKAYFLGCGFHGAQDTLCDDLGRHYYTECFIQGSIDFIFGNARSLFYRCEMHSVANVFGSIAAQNRRTPFEKTGFSFVQCKVTGKGPLYLGRAMGPYSRIVFAYSYFDDIVSGWDDWDHHTNHQNVFFGVYKCYGPGAREARRISWAQELSPAQAQPFLQETFINGKHWIDHGHP